MQLPHKLDRPRQQEAYQRIADSKARYVVCRMPTGLGKTAIAANLACEGYRTLSCVMTKSLQWQYVEPYGFTELFGKSNYICGWNHLERGKPLQPPDDPFVLASTADLCEMANESDEYKDLCRKGEGKCDYPLAREKMVFSQAGIINYHKFLLDRPVTNSIYSDTGGIVVKGFDPDVLVFDEAHELSDLVVNYSGLSYNWSFKQLMKYCKPVEIKPDERLPALIATKKNVEQGKEWLTRLLHSLNNNEPIHPLKKNGCTISEWKWYKNTIDKVDLVLGCLELEPHCWFVRADRFGITIRPKTAKYHFRSLFEKASKIVMMSATIQPRDIEALGIKKDEYEFISMPNPYPPAMRPVYDLKAPPLTAKSTYAECKQHAQVIANVFNSKPDHWNGIVHMPSKKKSEDWGEWLSQMTRRPIYVPERGLSTDEAHQRWTDFEANNAGAVAVCWNMMTGIDGKNININITGCVPYPNFKDEFVKARFNYNKSEAKTRIGNLMEQQMGRNRRGFDDHYGPNAEKYNALCDGKWTKLKSAMNKDFLRSIV